MNNNGKERLMLISELLCLAEEISKYYRDIDLEEDIDILKNSVDDITNASGNFEEISTRDLKRIVTCTRVLNKIMKDVHEGAKIISDSSIIEIDDSFFN